MTCFKAFKWHLNGICMELQWNIGLQTVGQEEKPANDFASLLC